MENIVNLNASLSLTMATSLLGVSSKAKTILKDTEAEMCI